MNDDNTTTSSVIEDARPQAGPNTSPKKATAAQKRAANNADIAQQDLGFFAPDLKKTVEHGGAILTDMELALIVEDDKKQREVKPDVVKERAESMKLIGQRDPIEIRPHGNEYIITDGHHRVAAARLLKWRTIRAIVVSADAAQAAAGAAVMNMARQQQNTYEDGAALARIQSEKPGITHETLGKIVGGRSAAWVSHRLRVHTLGPDVGPHVGTLEGRELTELEALANATGIEDAKLAQQVRDATRNALAKLKEEDSWHRVKHQIIDRLGSSGWRSHLEYPLGYDEASKRVFAKAPGVKPATGETIVRYFPAPEVKKLQEAYAAKQRGTKTSAKSGKPSEKEAAAAALARQKERREAEVEKRAADRELIVAAKGGAKANEDLEFQLLLRVLCLDAKYDDNQADRIAAATGLPFSGVKMWGKHGGQLGGYGEANEKARLEYVRGLKPDQRRAFVACIASVHVMRDEPDEILKLVARTSQKDVEAAVRKEVLAEEKAVEKGARPKKWWEDERRAACSVCKADKKQKCCSSPGGHTIATYHAERVAAAGKIPIAEPAPKKLKAKKAAPKKKAAAAAPDDDEDHDDQDDDVDVEE